MRDSSILPGKSLGKQTEESFGIYIHIPYCLQRCTYCDFATYVHTEIMPSQKYIELVKKELSLNKKVFPFQQLNTLYFGGGTPSLLPAEQIVDLITSLKQNDYVLSKNAEVTIEINPATIDERKINAYLENGINRFSVGAQSFSDRLLKMVHREHNAQQTIETLKLLESYKLNYSFDILFALPTQTLEELRRDLDIASTFNMTHASPYCLTVPEGHPLSKDRPLDIEQIEMFQIIHQTLVQQGFYRYEISNYAKPGYESRHNMLYWTDQPFWGLGLSAHSYSKHTPWGTRFWNPSNINLYEKELSQRSVSDSFPLNENNSEILGISQSLTDFCYTSLRLSRGLSWSELESKFGASTLEKIHSISKPLVDQQLLQLKDRCYSLTDKGVFISNQIFEKFTFLKDDFKSDLT